MNCIKRQKAQLTRALIAKGWIYLDLFCGQATSARSVWEEHVVTLQKTGPSPGVVWPTKLSPASRRPRLLHRVPQKGDFC